MAKWHEALTRPCHTSELEEWAHEEYFVTDANTDTIVLLPPGAARSRGLEQAAAAREMDSRVIIIGADDDGEARRAADVYFGMPRHVPEPLTPFVYKLPFEYLSCQIAHEQKAFRSSVPQSQAPAGEFSADLQFGAVGEGRAEGDGG